MHKSIIVLSTLAFGAIVGAGTASADTTYSVQSGDTLYKIAKANQTTVSDLASVNNITNANVISVGQQLKLSTSGQTESTATATNGTYTVKSGDTLNKIAQANNTTVADLVAINNISDSNFITVGQKLSLTGTTTAQPEVKVTTPAVTQAPAETTQQVTTSTQTTQSTDTTAQASSATTASTTTSATQTSSDVSDALQALINRESSGNVNATNGQYYGIGQLSPQARAMYGGNSTDYNDQLNAMKAYISARYGTAENAYAHSNATGWY